MKAKVKPDYPWSFVTAFAGREYTKRDWRAVPPGHEEEARLHQFLDIEEEAVPLTPFPDDMESLTKAELVALGEARGVDVSMSMRKDELIEALEPAVSLSTDLPELTVAQLKGLAAAAGIEGYSNMRKAELIEALETAQIVLDDEEE